MVSIHFSWLGPELFRLLRGTGVQLMIFFCFRFPVVLFGRPGMSCNTLYLLSPGLCFFIVLKRDLCVYCDDY